MTYKSLADWVVPFILGVATWNLQKIQEEIGQINKTVATATQQILDLKEGEAEIKTRLTSQGQRISQLEKEIKY